MTVQRHIIRLIQTHFSPRDGRRLVRQVNELPRSEQSKFCKVIKKYVDLSTKDQKLVRQKLGEVRLRIEREREDKIRKQREREEAAIQKRPLWYPERRKANPLTSVDFRLRAEDEERQRRIAVGRRLQVSRDD